MNELADKVLRITSTYLGPASRNLLERLCISYLGIPLELLEKKHIPELSRHIERSAGRVIDKNHAAMLAKILARLA